MLTQSLPSSAEAYGAAQRTEIAAAVAAVRRLWGRVGDDFDVSYARVEPQILAILDLAQERVIAGAVEYIPAVLAETNPAALAGRPDYALQPWSLVGTAGGGNPTDTLAYEAVIHAKSRVAAGVSVAQALESAGSWLGTATGTLLSDTGRTVEKVEASARRAGTFVRMLQPPSCGRCVILAGRRTRRETAFERHPGCDCRNIPAAESIADDLTVNPREYLDSLDDKGLAKALGSQSNARAYREGADPAQIVNAYRSGIRKAQVYGRTVKYTTEGTTRRGLANWRMRQAGYIRAGGEAKNSGRYRSLRAPRLMPESIYEIAESPADAQRLLRLYGWVL